jgi:NADPH2:quinone reductase
MQAAYIEKTGSVDEIFVGELPEPTLGPRDVLVRVEAAALDHVDLLVRAGRFDPGLTFPYVLGRDAAGTVEAVGAEARRFKRGDRVWSNVLGLHGRRGAFAQFTAASEDSFWPLPDNVEPARAAASLHSALTAVVGLGKMRVQRGETMFVGGGASNVGQAVIALAASRGVRVIAAAGSDEGTAVCRSVGAQGTVNYRTTDVAAAVQAFSPKGVDLWWEGSREPDLGRALDLMAPGGRAVVITGFNFSTTFEIRRFYLKNLTLAGFAVSTLPEETVRAANDQINEAFETEVLPAPHVERLPLAAARQAQTLLEAGRVRGKIVLIP